jgi:hypothetical protein
MDYQVYLQSDHWKETRKKALKFWGGRCAVCRSSHLVEVHHNNYHTLGHEQLSDMVCLCSLCHELYSSKMKSGQVEPIQNVLQRLQRRYIAKHGGV